MRKKSAALSDTGLQTVSPAGNTEQLPEGMSVEDLLVIVRQQQDNSKKAQKQIDDLTQLVKRTTDSNKIRAYEREIKEFSGFAFSLRLFPTDKGGRVVTRWKTNKNFVADAGRITNQLIDIWYDDDGKEEKRTIDLVDFTRVLMPTGPLVANRLENLDGSDVHIDFRVNPETKKTNAFLCPREQEFIAYIEYEGKEYRISSVYLNA